MKEVNLEWNGFYKKIAMPDDYYNAFIDISIIPSMRLAISALTGIPEDVIRTKQMRFEQDFEVRTLYKFREIV